MEIIGGDDMRKIIFILVIFILLLSTVLMSIGYKHFGQILLGVLAIFSILYLALCEEKKRKFIENFDKKYFRRKKMIGKNRSKKTYSIVNSIFMIAMLTIVAMGVGFLSFFGRVKTKWPPGY